VAEEKPGQAGDKARRDKLMEQIQSSCGQTQGVFSLISLVQ
jgi:hypothetical protein